MKPTPKGVWALLNHIAARLDGFRTDLYDSWSYGERGQDMLFKDFLENSAMLDTLDYFHLTKAQTDEYFRLGRALNNHRDILTTQDDIWEKYAAELNLGMR